MNWQVIAASVDSKFTHLAWINTPRNKGSSNFTLLLMRNVFPVLMFVIFERKIVLQCFIFDG